MASFQIQFSPEKESWTKECYLFFQVELVTMLFEYWDIRIK